MNLFSLYAKIGLDTSEYEKKVDKASESAEEMAEKMEDVAESVENTEESVSDLSDELENATSAIEDFVEQTKESETEAKSTETAIRKLGLSSKELTNYNKTLKNELKSVDSQVLELNAKYKQSVTETGRYSDQTKKLAEELDDAKKKQSDLREELEKSSVSVQKYGFNLQDLGSKIATGLKVAVGTVATLVVAAGKIGLDYNAQMETYTTNFEVMLGSAEEAAKKVEDISKMASKTPFELSDLASATQTLLAFNVSADESNAVLQQLGDISLGNTQKLESLVRAYGKMNASQKVTLEDINMMIDAGFNPLLIVAEQTGESMEDLYARISDGEVAFSEIQGAIAAATSEGGQFYQGMEKASQTTKGLVSTLQDVVKSKAGEFFQGVSDKIQEMLPNVISFVENIDVEEVTEKLESLYNTFVDLSPIIAGVTAAIIAFKTEMTIAALIQGVTTAITAFKAANEGATIAQAALNAVMNLNPFVLIATLVAGVVVALITLWNTNEDFRNAVIEIWEGIQEFLGLAIETVTGFFQSLAEFVMGLPGTIQQAFNDIVNRALQLGSDIVEKIKTGISNAWNGLTSWFNNLWNSLFSGRSVDVSVNGSSNVDGSHRSGLSYVPFDGYIAELHRGEQVLTAQEASDYRSGKSSGGVTVIQNIYSEAKTAADLMLEARHQQERAVLFGV